MFDHLFVPITINGMTLRNRIVAAPTSDEFREKAAGGAALVIAGHTIVEPGRSSFASADEPWLFEKYQREAARERVLACHRYGAKASIEIFHGGLHARVADFAKGPCSFVREDGVEVKGMDRALMEETLSWYEKTCQGAKKAGFDSIFLHFGHGWLPAQFLSPFYNHRDDEYGGSIENRMRFPLEILACVRKAVGPVYPIDMRVSADEWVEGGIAFEDLLSFLKEGERYIDAVQISCGIDINKCANVHTVTTNLEEEMPNLAYARKAKEVLHIPVGVVGAVLTPENAEQILESGSADLIALGRELIADPAWAKKAEAGRPEDILPCLRCSNCYHIASDHWNVGCSVNPHFHNEAFVPAKIEKADSVQKVVVVGSGPCGLNAAIAAAERGHEVTLIEKSSELGGMLCTISKEAHKEGISRLLQNLIHRVDELPIEVMLDTEAMPELISGLGATALCLAMGAQERRIEIPGADPSSVLTTGEAILATDRLGQRVAVIGGGSAGCEIALELAETGHEVSLIEMTGALAGNANTLYQEALRQKFELFQDRIQVHLEASCERTEDGALFVKQKDGEEASVPYDSIVLSVGTKARAQEAEGFFGIVRHTIAAGDCVRPRSIMEATFEGQSFGATL